jgi:tRNA threonylcarbamoyladenosine biosynthesis protein TsaE
MPPHPARRKTRVPDGGATTRPGRTRPSRSETRPRLDSLAGPPRSLVVQSDDPARTLEIGRSIGELLPRGAVLSLEGGLGVGKTLIAKGICAGLGVADEVTSPSFVLAEEYAGAFPVLHFDLYRLDSVDEVARIGLFDAIDGRNVVIVEWGDRLPAGTFDADVRIVMDIAGERSRAIRIEGAGDFVERLEGRIA